METLNLTAAWLGFLVGMLGGAVRGLFFHREDWLGGYGTWARRLLRLGHISLFGLAIINLAFDLTAHRMGWRIPEQAGPRAASLLLVAGAVLMPVVCCLAAWQRPLRFLFPLPVLSLAGGVVVVLWTLVSGP